MKVRVLLFAVLRDAAGMGEVMLELPALAKLSDVKEPLVRMFPPLAGHLSRVALALNRNYADADARLSEGDEVALIPPVSGG